MLPVNIPPEFEQFVAGQVACGSYQSTEAVLSDALRMLRERKLEALRKEIQVGIDQLDRGEGIEIEGEQGLKEFFDRIEEEGLRELEAEKGRR